MGDVNPQYPTLPKHETPISTMTQTGYEQCPREGGGEGTRAGSQRAKPSMTTPKPPRRPSSLQAEVKDRFGVLPNFFCLGGDAPEITTNLWGFAQFGLPRQPVAVTFQGAALRLPVPVLRSSATALPGTSASWSASGGRRAIGHLLRRRSSRQFG